MALSQERKRAASVVRPTLLYPNVALKSVMPAKADPWPVKLILKSLDSGLIPPE